MTRILFLYHVSSIGGGSFCLLNLLKAIDRNRFEPIAILPQYGPLCEELKKLDIKVEYCNPIQTVPYNASLLQYNNFRRIPRIQKGRKELKALMQRLSPDVLYINSMMLHPYLQPAKELGVKTVIHVREHWPEGEHTIQRKYAINNICQNADQIVAINSYSASMFQSVKEKVTVVYDWIDMESRRGGPTIKELLGEDCTDLKVYLYTGAIAQIKGTLEVINTFTDNIKGDNRRLLMLGVDPKIYRDGLRGKLKGLLVSIGYVTYFEKVKFACQKDKRIVCTPATYKITSLMEQASGMVSYFTIPHANLALAEGLILGLPNVAANTEESEEYSNKGEGAFLYPINDLDAFKKAWIFLDENLETQKLKAKAASKVISNMFDAKRNAEVFNGVLYRI